MVKRLSVLLTLVLAITHASAQSTIKGQVVDSLTNEGEPYATVRVFRQKNTKEPVAMSVSDIDGNFSQTINGKGTYVVTVNAVGRKEISRTVMIDGKTTIDLGTLLFIDDAHQLQGVEVVAQKPLVKMETDKMTYNVEDDKDSKTATVLDMLRKVPMVTVDGQDNITVNGSSSFKVYVNGKPNIMFQSNPAQVFKSMPASMVKKIEVITNPGAKYDAEGTGGVLNIEMAGQGGQQTELNGVNGNLRATYGEKIKNLSAFINGQYGRFSFSVNAIANYGKTSGTEMSIERENIGDGSTMRYEMKGTTRAPIVMTDVNLGYELDSMSSAHVTFGMNSFSMKNSGHPTTTFTMGNGGGFGYQQSMSTENKRRSLDFTADYQRFLNRAKTSSITLLYQYGHNPTTNDNRSRSEGLFTPNGDEMAFFNDMDGDTPMVDLDLSDRYSHSKEKSDEHVIQTDYTTPLAENHKLNAGAKLTLRNNSSDSRYYQLDGDEQQTYIPELSMRYKHQDRILAGYAEYEGKFGKFGGKAGLRYEHTWQDVTYELGNGENFKKDYGNLVPTASLSWQMSQNANIGMTYNFRISRPGISYLNPYVDRSSNTAVTYGNPELEVEKNHNIGMVFNLYTSKFMANVNLHHNFTNNGMSEYSFFGNDGLLNTTYGNIVKKNSTGANVWASLMLAKTSRIFMNGGVSYVDVRSNELSARNHGWQANMMAGLNQTLPWKIELGTFFIVNSKNYTLQGWSSGFSMLSFSLNKLLFNDKLNIGVQAFTGLRKKGRLNIENYSRGSDFVNHQTMSIPIANIALTLSWSFGNSKVKGADNRARTSDDVMERQNQLEKVSSMGGTGF